MKKRPILCILHSLLTISLLFSSPSQAAVGVGLSFFSDSGKSVTYAGAGMAALGAIGMGVGVLVGGAAAPTLTLAVIYTMFGTAGIMFSGALAAIGVIVLDDPNGIVEFASLTLEEGERFGLSDEELNAFNNELPVINSILNEITHQSKEYIDRDLEAGKTQEESKETLEILAANSASLAQEFLSPEAMHALVKVTTSNLNSQRQ